MLRHGFFPISAKPNIVRATEPMEALLAKHRKEQKDLQSQITQKKKSASKKTRKGVNDECARLEQELKERHVEELAALSGKTTDSREANNENEAGSQNELLDSIIEGQSLEQQTADLAISQQSDEGVLTDDGTAQRKPNRQKARLARRAAEQEAIAAAAAEEAAAMPDLKQAERERMLAEFTKRGLREKEVAANGHCMYSAVADQMRQLGLGLDVEHRNAGLDPATVQINDYKIVRQAAATYIAGHPEDFTPFLEEPLDQYLQKLRDTGEWGGQVELLALAKAYAVTFNVLQGEGRLEKVESTDEEPRGEAWLAYYRHGFGLGEHYNSLRKAGTAQSNG